MRCLRMKRIDHSTEGPNIAGVSLALYLLVSILTMMAAYDVGKASDDPRNSVVHTLQSSTVSPNKATDDSGGDLVLVEVRSTEFIPVARPSAVSGAFQTPSRVARAFNARAPPAHPSLAA